QDVIVMEEDCGTLRGIEISSLKKNEEVVETLSTRILGRTSLHDIYDMDSGEKLVSADEIITEEIADSIQKAGIEIVEVRSPLTCEAKTGICTSCYGRNLSTGKKVQKGEAVGVVAAQSIGEPGTQLTLRTFHVGGTAGNVSEQSSIVAKANGRLEFEDLRTVKGEDEHGNPADVVVSRSTEMKLIDADGNVRMTNNIAYGSILKIKDGKEVTKGDVIASWDPYNGVIIAESAGKVEYENIEQGSTFQLEIDEQTGFQEKVISDSRNKKLIPTLKVLTNDGEERNYNLPVGAHLIVNDGEKIKAGKVL